MKNLIKYLKEIIYLVGDDKKKLPFMVLIFISSSALDLIGIGLIGFYIGLIVSPEQLLKGNIKDILIQLGFSLEILNLLVIFGLLLVCLFFMKGITAVLIKWRIIKFSADRQNYLIMYLMQAYQKLPYVDYIKRNSSEYIQSILVIVAQFTNTVLNVLLQLISEGIVALVLIVFLAWTNFKAVAVLFLLLSIIFFLYDKIFRRNVKRYGELSNEGSEETIQSVNEGFEGLKEIRILGKEFYFRTRVQKGAEKTIGYNAKANIINSSSKYILEFVVIIFIVTMVISFSTLDVDILTLIPVFGMFAAATIRLLPFASLLLGGVLNLRFGRFVTGKLYSDIMQMENCASHEESYSQDAVLSGRFASLKLEQVCFRYPDAKNWALKDLDFSIKAGESIGIIGPSGAGKTTLVDILLGVLHPQKGVILYNGKAVEDLLRGWNSQVAYLPQEIFLIDDTIRRNVALGLFDDEILEEKVYEALRQSHLMSLLEQLPEGLDTELGERGVRLSGGQKQRVALARAFYHNRKVLVLDEATSSLDNETEKEIVDEIKYLKGQITLVVIAHRLSTVEHCDKIYRLENGRIVEQGTYDEVVKKNNK